MPRAAASRISFESLYSFLIAPAWWIHSTAAAYAAIKYLNAVVMCLTALPAYGSRGLLLPRRTDRRGAALDRDPGDGVHHLDRPGAARLPLVHARGLAAVHALAAPTRRTVALAVVARRGRARSSARSSSCCRRRSCSRRPLTWVIGDSAGELSWRRILAARAVLAVFAATCSTGSSSSTCRAGTFGAVLQPAHDHAGRRSPAARSRSGSGSCP